MKITQVKAYGAETAKSSLKQLSIARRELSPEDIEIDILYCGVCHTDLHTVQNDWGATRYPVVPGHEIVGRITKVGSEVSKFKVGDLAGVGFMVDSCRQCTSCQHKLEQYCISGSTSTYGSKDKHLGGYTFGGYSEKIVVTEHFVLKIPRNLDPAATAPLLCAGITVWSPLRHWKVNKHSSVAVIGLGGLGHMAIKLAKALGAHVTLFSRSPNKEKDARELGSDRVIISTDARQMASVKGNFNLILDTVPDVHDVNHYIPSLAVDGTLILVGYLGPLDPMLNSAPLILGRKSVAGSIIGGITETQEMLDFCSEHHIVSEIEMINMQDINEAYKRMLKSDVRYRFVIDMASLKK